MKNKLHSVLFLVGGKESGPFESMLFTLFTWCLIFFLNVSDHWSEYLPRIRQEIAIV